MKLFIIGSMQFSEKMLELRSELESFGHEVTLSAFVESFVGKSDQEKEVIKLEQKNAQDAMRVDCKRIEGRDGVLVLNFDKNGIDNYIGGNALIEMGYAHILGQKIFLYNSIPNIPFYETEIIAMQPVILNGDLSLIR